MKRLLILSLAMSVAMPAIAQTQMPVYRDRSGSFQGASGVVVLNADGTPATGTGATSEQTQGTAANGAAPMGNPNLVAGSDGTNVRTIRTLNTGAVMIAGGNGIGDGVGQTAGVGLPDAGGVARAVSTAGMVLGSGVLTYQREARFADATTGGGLLGAGILGQYQTTLPTYTAGQFGTLAMTSRGILQIAPVGTGTFPNGANYGSTLLFSDPTGVTRPLGVADFMYDPGTGSMYAVRGDTTGGLYTQERERSQFFAEAPGILAANGTFPGTNRDGSVSPSQWGTFSCFINADQASASAGFAILGSNDGTNFFVKVAATVAANTPTRITDRNDTRYSRCRYVNGATANTAAPILNSSFGG